MNLTNREQTPLKNEEKKTKLNSSPDKLGTKQSSGSQVLLNLFLRPLVAHLIFSSLMLADPVLFYLRDPDRHHLDFEKVLNESSPGPFVSALRIHQITSVYVHKVFLMQNLFQISQPKQARTSFRFNSDLQCLPTAQV